jgi:hypothetical protein
MEHPVHLMNKWNIQLILIQFKFTTERILNNIKIKLQLIQTISNKQNTKLKEQGYFNY